MSSPDAETWRTRLGVGLQVLGLGASLGTLIGLGRAAGRIAVHGYWGLGFRRTIFLELRDTATAGAGVGFTLALGVFGSWWLAHRLWPGGRRFLGSSLLSEIARQRELRWRVSALILASGWLVVTVAAYLGAPRRFATAVAISGLFFLALVWGSAHAARSFREDRESAFRALLGATYATALLGLAGAYLQNQPYLRNPLAATNIIGNLALLAAVGLMFPVVRSSMRPGRRPPLLPALVPVALLGIAWLATPALSRPGLRAGHPKSVVLIGIDTLRLDDTSLVDSATRDLTPHLKRLAGRAASFGHAVSQASWTMPAFASVITGRYPQEHGAISLSGRLDERALTLAELLKEAGYRTSGIVAHRYVDSRHGFAQGFATFNEDNSVGHVGITSQRVTDLGLDFLRTAAGQPFFLFVHYFDPHFRYQDHPDLAWADGYQGWIQGAQNEFGNLRAKRHLLDDADLRFLRDLYQEEIAATDREIGRLLDGVSAHGLDDEAAVIVVADHGEEFMDRGWLGHTTSMYDEILRVPLIMRLPGIAAGRRIDRPVETRQIFSTVLDYLRLEGGGRGLRRESLLPLLREDRDSPPAYRGPPAAFSATLLSDAPIDSGKRVNLFAMREGSWKLILDATRGRELLFDLGRDPLEQTDLAAAEPEKLDAMRQRLQGWIQDMQRHGGPTSKLELNAEEIEQLKALGYL